MFNRARSYAYLPILTVLLMHTNIASASTPSTAARSDSAPSAADASSTASAAPSSSAPSLSASSLVAAGAAAVSSASGFASSTAASSLTQPADATLIDAPLPQNGQAQAGPTQPAQPPSTTASAGGGPKQTKRILFIIPNFRSVSADEKLPPTTTRQKFKLTLDDTFDYSAFAETAILAGMGEAQTSEPEFHGGFPGYARYYWHSYADLADGNLMTEFLFPVTTREDPRYYTLGHSGFPRRTVYAISRLVITRNNQGNNTVNLSEIAGNGAAAAISGLYYPRAERGWTKTGQRWVLQVGIDGLSNFVKEFWPEVNRDLFKGKY